MSLVFWRICRAIRAATAFDGEGARLYPGRWNHKGVPVVYCASSVSLATLDYFVHVDPDDVPDDLVTIRAELPARVAIERIEVTKLPKDWRDYPAPDALKTMGSDWARSLRSVALRVPSAVTPIEDNIVFNPRHPDFARLSCHPAEPFAFDPRLFKK